MVRVFLAILAATVLLWIIPGAGISLAQTATEEVTLRVEGMV